MNTESTPRAEGRRIFYALWPEAHVAAQLHRIARRHAPPEARVMRTPTLHLTLAFIGDTPPETIDAVEAAGDALCWPRCTLMLDQLGLWRHNQILWAAPSVTPEPLATLAEELAARLRGIGVRLESRRFAPHVTLARRCRALAREPAFAPVEWHIEGGVLVESIRTAHGAEYRVRRAWGAE